ncbi:hypothetical protein HPB50_022692 [Hyalomma asiaticum]|uniref:Uncharacterized protein n=1 Tax=Hyalomma asiaticum TaxID=266040 RepID=A0ACB7T4A9_HYAAI|nr:hypothetical protein HPB50_022692 [Hyalomma asiaticum]
MLWLCPNHSETQLSIQDAWHEVLTSNDYKLQLQLVQRARDIATSLPLPAASGEEPLIGFSIGTKSASGHI